MFRNGPKWSETNPGHLGKKRHGGWGSGESPCFVMVSLSGLSAEGHGVIGLTRMPRTRRADRPKLLARSLTPAPPS